MRAAILQHLWCESPGYFEGLLKERGIDLEVIELDEGKPLPEIDSIDLVLALGGPMSVNDEASHSFLIEEKQWIAEAVHQGIPYFGVCLGAQLLAAALGARVYQGAVPEVGVLPVRSNRAATFDPVFMNLAPEFTTLQWHGDTFDIPNEAEPLVSSELYENQAFRWGQYAYGVQFHLEVTMDMVEQWGQIPEYIQSLKAVMGDCGFEQLTQDIAQHEQDMQESAVTMFGGFLDVVMAKNVETLTSTN